MRVVELMSLARECGLRGYSRLRKSGLIDLIRNNPPPPVPQPTSSKYTKFKSYQLRSERDKRSEPFLEPPVEQTPPGPATANGRARLRQRGESASGDPKKFKRMKKKLDELIRKIRHSRKKHDGMIHKRNSVRKAIETLKRGTKTEPLLPLSRAQAPEPEFIFKGLDQAFGRAYRSYRVKEEPKMDYDAFFIRVREGLTELISTELNKRYSAKIKTSIWIRLTKDDDVVNLAFNSLMVNVYRGSDLDQIVDGMIAHMKFQIENPALLNSRFAFDKVLHLDVNFHQLSLTRGRSYVPLPDYIANRKVVINPQNDDWECFKWVIIAADRWTDIGSHLERISNLRKFVNNYDWSGLEFPVSLKQIGKFEINNDISVNVLGLEDKEIRILRKGRTHNRGLDLLMISENEINHYTAIKSLSRLLRSSNTKHHGKQYFCMNCLHGFPAEAS